MRRSVKELEARLEEAEELLRATPSGEVDALVVSRPHGRQVYTLNGAELPYRVMVETMSEGAVILTPDRTIVYANHSFAAMIETPLDEVIGSVMDRFVPPEDRSRYETLNAQGLTGTGRGEIRLTAKGGASVPVYLSISSLEPDAPHSACAVLTDLTEQKRHQELIAAEAVERKRAEEQLRQSETDLAEAQRTGHVGSWVWNVSTGECLWSLEHFHLFGVDPRSFKPTKDTSQRLIHPQDLPRVEQTLQQAIRAKGNFEVDYRIVRPDGSIRHHRGLGHPVVRESGHLEFVGTVIDVTERKHAEEQLRRSEALLAEGQRISQTASWVWNVATGEIFWSTEHFRICGVDPATFALTPETAQRCIHPEDRPAANQAFDTAIREASDFEREFRILRPDGTIRYAFSLGRPVFSENGELTEYVGTIMDITDRREEEVARRELQRRLAVAHEDERRRIALEMHDEFGQQLSALTLKLSALKRECGRRKTLGAELASLEAIARQLDTDLELIISRVRPPALDDLGLVAALTNYVRRWSEHFDVRVQLHASGMESSRVTDEIDTTLYRIVQEALNNVAKHARARNVAILLDRGSDRVSLIVEDDGVGFDAALAEKPDRGFGVIGMRERAGLLGGTLDIESIPNRGATLVARIPLPPSPEPNAT